MSILSLETPSAPKCIKCGAAPSSIGKFCGECGATRPSHAAKVVDRSMIRSNRIALFVLAAVVILLASSGWISAHPITAKAQYDLGLKYENGNGVQKNEAQALSWFRKAAEQGYADAQNCLGVMYEDGVGVPKDAGQAANWYQKAAAQDFQGASERLANVQRASQSSADNVSVQPPAQDKPPAQNVTSNDQHFSLNGLTLGQSEAQVNNQMNVEGWSAQTCTTSGRGVQNCIFTRIDGERIFDITVDFLDGNSCRVQYAFPNKSFDAMLSAFRNAYGDEDGILKKVYGKIVWTNSSQTVFLNLDRNPAWDSQAEGVVNSALATLVNKQAMTEAKQR